MVTNYPNKCIKATLVCLSLSWVVHVSVIKGNSDIFKPGSYIYMFLCVRFGIGPVHRLSIQPRHDCNIIL